MEMIIEPLNPSDAAHNTALTCLMSEYFPELDAADLVPYVPKIVNKIGTYVVSTPHWLFLCRIDGRYVGFIQAQIDSPTSNWNKREGWGFIRELYVTPPHRKQGAARLLVAMAEQSMLRGGAVQAYLTTETPDFWHKLGYSFSGEIDAGNGSQIGEKKLG